MRPRKARANIAAHYDLGNDFYSAWLDETMTYTSGALSPRLTTVSKRRSAARSTLLLDRLDLKPGQRLLEIGCGWGSLAIEAAKRGVEVVGLTLSTEQKAWAEEKIAEPGLADQIEIRLQDYRETAEQFDAVASVEMVEAVGQRWWGAYLDCIARNLQPPAAARRCSSSAWITACSTRYARNPDFIQTYIFPGGMLLDEPRVRGAGARAGPHLAGPRRLPADYAETLNRWRERYDLAVARGELADFGEAFHNLWRYYLMYCEGGFRGGAIDVAQVTLIKQH